MSLATGSAVRGRAVAFGHALSAPLALLLALNFPPPAEAASGSGALQPTPLGEGMCQARRFADGSVQAQIAVHNAPCAVATGTLGPAADRAKGAPYSAGGFTCRATPEGAGSPWVAAWGGTYYAYSCAHGAAQAAFNWGRDYTY